MASYRRDVQRELENNGYWKLPDRGKGSHEVWTNGRRNQTVPRKLNDRNLANQILKDSGINRRFAWPSSTPSPPSESSVSSAPNTRARQDSG